MENEIKPRLVNGEPLCNNECQLGCSIRQLFNVEITDTPCISGIRQQRDDALADVAVLENLFQQQNSILKQIYGILQSAEVVDVRPPLIKAELGCMTCRNASRKVADTYCDGCELRGGDNNGSKWQPLQRESSNER